MGVLINAALGALAGVVGSLVGAMVGGSRLALPAAILAGLAGYFAGGALAPSASTAALTGGKKGGASSGMSALEEEEQKKSAKKAKKAAAEARKKEEAAAARVAAEEEKALRKREAKNAKKKAAAAAAAPVESEPEAEPEAADVDDAPKSKSALKKAKQKAKEAAAKAEAEAAAKAAEAAAKKKAKKEKKAAEKAAAGGSDPAGDKAAAEKAAAAAAAAAAEEEGWETIEPTKPTKSQLARAAANAAQPASTKKNAPIPASERLLTEDLIIPVKNHALIIGAKGATLQLLTEGSGATIDMPKRESGSAKIQITGTPAQVAQAKNAIQSLVDRGFSNLTHPGILSDDISVDPKDVGLILGANGVHIKQIQSETSTKINLPEKGSTSKKVTIVGEKEGVKRAKAALRSLLNDGFSTITHPGWVKLDIDFPLEKIGLLVGPKGQTIKSIQGDTKTRINTPDRDSKGAEASHVSVCGLPADVARAEKQILKLLEPPPPLPAPEEEDLATDDAWGQQHTAQGEDALW